MGTALSADGSAALELLDRVRAPASAVKDYSIRTEGQYVL